MQYWLGRLPSQWICSIDAKGACVAVQEKVLNPKNMEKHATIRFGMDDDVVDKTLAIIDHGDRV